MAKRYEHVGILPVVVEGYGRVLPGAKFSCEMTEAQEAFLVKVRAVQVLDVLPEGATVEEPPLDSVWPTNWPATPAEQAKREGVRPPSGEVVR